MAVGAHHGTFTLWEVSSGTITSAVLVCFCLAGVPWPARTCVIQSSWLLKTTSTWTARGMPRYLTHCTTTCHDRARLAELLGAAYSTTKASHRETNFWGFFSFCALNRTRLPCLVQRWWRTWPYECGLCCPQISAFFFQCLIMADASEEWPVYGGVSLRGWWEWATLLFHYCFGGSALLVTLTPSCFLLV